MVGAAVQAECSKWELAGQTGLSMFPKSLHAKDLDLSGVEWSRLFTSGKIPLMDKPCANICNPPFFQTLNHVFLEK